MQEQVSITVLSAVYLKRSSRQKPTEWAWGFRSADPLWWLMAASFLSRPVICTVRSFILSFPSISRARDVEGSGDTAADPVRGGKQEADLKEVVEEQSAV